MDTFEVAKKLYRECVDTFDCEQCEYQSECDKIFPCGIGRPSDYSIDEIEDYVIDYLERQEVQY